MKALKFILGAIYVILIILLLLLGLKSCKRTDRHSDNPIAQAEETGGMGDLKITLLWDFDGDIDLHVIEPNGNEIFWDNKVDGSTGGTLDVDNREGGNGSAENIYWEQPPKGQYKVFLHYFDKSSLTGVVGSGTCSVIIFEKGKEPKTYNVHMSTLKEKIDITNIIIE